MAPHRSDVFNDLFLQRRQPTFVRRVRVVTSSTVSWSWSSACSSLSPAKNCLAAIKAAMEDKGQDDGAKAIAEVDVEDDGAKATAELMLAAVKGDVDAVRGILKCGRGLIEHQHKDVLEGAHVDGPADVLNLNAVDERGDTCLHLAAASGHADIVAELVKVGRAGWFSSGGRCKDSSSSTGRSDVDVLSEIDVNLKNKEGLTPLLAATKGGWKDAVEALLTFCSGTARLDLGLKDNESKNARQRAKADGFREIEAMLKEAEREWQQWRK